jgi:hypothetical protein
VAEALVCLAVDEFLQRPQPSLAGHDAVGLPER